METLIDTNFDSLRENRVITDRCSVEMVHSKIVFLGTNNVVYFAGDSDGDHLQMVNSSIECKGDNNLILIQKSKYPLRCKISAGHGTTIYLGRNFWATTPALIIANECSSIHIGDWALLARDVCIRTADMHMIYDIASHKRINPNRSVYVGEHVWIGQDTGIMKGAVIGSGSIVGWGSLVGKGVNRVNAVYAGRPAKLLRDGITWRHKGSNQITEQEVYDGTYDTLHDNKFIYTQEQMDERHAEWEKGVSPGQGMDDRLAFVLNYSCLGNS